MAATPGFGGTKGVAELNLGQPGSARETANTARYAVRVEQQNEDAGVAFHPLNDQPVTFAETTGFKGKLVVWRGQLKVATINELSLIKSHVAEFHTGQTITAGVRSAVDAAKKKATKLTDYFGEVVSTTAVLTGAVFGEVYKLSNDATFSHGCELTITFRVLA